MELIAIDEKPLYYHPDLFLNYVVAENAKRRFALGRVMLPALDQVNAGRATNVNLVGSDGKEERYPQSKTEMVILRRPEEPSVRQELTALFDLKTLHLETAYDGLFGEYVVPYRGQQSIAPLSFQYGNRDKIYPDFLFNSHPLDSDPTSPAFETYVQARIQILREMGGNDSLGSLIRKAMRKQLSSYRQGLIKNGIYGGEMAWDQSQVYYDEADTLEVDGTRRPMNFGIKIPMIRSIQRKLDIKTAELVHREPDEGLIYDIAVLSPALTPDRILFLSQMGLIPEAQAARLRSAYNYFLQLQHRAQAEYKKIRSKVAIPFVSEEFQQQKAVVEDFVITK